MKVVYLAGPYRGETEYGVHQNIQRAEAVALEVWRLGAACLCPHKNTAYFGGFLPDEVWLEGARELLRRADAIFLMDNWEISAGAESERKLARDIGKPILFSLDELRTWLAN